MDRLNRASLDGEIERIHEKMSEIDPCSEEYGKLLKQCDVMMRCANEDDKIQADAKLEELKLEADSEKARENSKWQKIGVIVSSGVALLTSVTTLGCYIILCAANSKAQQRSIMFEMDGFAHTDRSDKFMQKAPLPRV